MTEVFIKEEKKLLMELICNEQIHMIIKNHTRYDSDKYKKLEKLKVKVKDMWGGENMDALIFVLVFAFGAICDRIAIALAHNI